MGCPAGRSARRERSRLELADVFRAHAHELGRLHPGQTKAMRAILRCRTAALGGHVGNCDHCGYRDVSYNSCRDRHCPKCQGLREARWVEARKAELLPVEYFHIVFTLPDLLHPLLLANPKVGYDLLFSAVRETLHEVALRPKNLGARIGLTAVLHTWTQKLLYHPHLHCIVPGGGLDAGGTRWISSKPGFFLPVRILSRVFRGKFLSRLELALANGEIHFSKDDAAWRMSQAARNDWVVFCKPPFAGPEQVLQYLGRYTHRIAISNDRLVSLRNGRVTFSWKDRANGNQKNLLTLDAREFLRRFLLHVLPTGFVRIRHYGLLANRVRRSNLDRCRKILGTRPSSPDTSAAQRASEPWEELLFRLTGKDVTRCPRCREGRLIRTELRAASAREWNLPGRASSP